MHWRQDLKLLTVWTTSVAIYTRCHGNCRRMSSRQYVATLKWLDSCWYLLKRTHEFSACWMMARLSDVVLVVGLTDLRLNGFAQKLAKRRRDKKPLLTCLYISSVVVLKPCISFCLLSHVYAFTLFLFLFFSLVWSWYHVSLWLGCQWNIFHLQSHVVMYKHLLSPIKPGRQYCHLNSWMIWETSTKMTRVSHEFSLQTKSCIVYFELWRPPFPCMFHFWVNVVFV